MHCETINRTCLRPLMPLYNMAPSHDGQYEQRGRCAGTIHARKPWSRRCFNGIEGAAIGADQSLPPLGELLLVAHHVLHLDDVAVPTNERVSRPPTRQETGVKHEHFVRQNLERL